MSFLRPNMNNSGETFRYVSPLLSHLCLPAVSFDGYNKIGSGTQMQ